LPVSAVPWLHPYRDAGYFERNVRTIEVLIDRDAAENGTAAAGEP